MQSPDIKRLQDFFEARRFTFVTDVLWRPNQPQIVVSVPETLIGRKASRETTSHRQLAILRNQIKQQLQLDVEFVLIRDPLQQHIEAGLNALLQTRFADQVGAAYLSAQSDGTYDIWIEKTAEGVGDLALSPLISEALAEYLKLIGARIGVVRVIGAQTKAPSVPVILRAAKRLAPVEAGDLLESLVELGFIVPSTSWLESKLDTLRRRNLLIRLRTGRYVLSESGLSIVPHGRARHSSDVERALA